jgi:tRNA A-37 threonylcarbamoyl transferase component Bud32
VTPEQWQRVKDVLAAALEQPPSERQAYLDRACVDADIRREVESLVAADVQGDTRFLEHAAVGSREVLQIGTKLGPYEILGSLGSGGMGAVYRARDERLDRDVAIKVLRHGLLTGESARKRFRTEALALAKLSHPHVAVIHDVGEQGGIDYLVMECVAGQSLAEKTKTGPLPEKEVVSVGMQIADALAEAHAHGLVHCDLKPANVMVTPKAQVKVLDFGLAKLLQTFPDSAPTQSFTETRSMAGTLPYMSPEQVRGEALDARTDLFSFGVLLYEMATGVLPFRGNTAGVIADAILNRTAVAPVRLNPNVSPKLEELIYRALEKNPDLRYQHAADMRAELQRLERDSALVSRETPSVEAVADSGAVEGLRVPIAAACLTAVVVGLVALCFLRQHFDIVNQVPMENSSEVLAASARQIAKTLGYTERPLDTSFGWDYDVAYLRYLGNQRNPSMSRAHLASNRPPAAFFWYRESSHYLIVAQPFGSVTRFNPPEFDTGMLDAVMDSEGRLLELNAQRSAETSDRASAPPPEWNRLFAAAGLDADHLVATEPILTPPVAWDVRAAWTGSWDNSFKEALRVEAAAYRGRPVFFRLVGPWTHPSQASNVITGHLSVQMFVLFAIVLPTGAAFLAWRNAGAGRGDKEGAFRLAGFVFLWVLGAALLSNHHVPTTAEFSILFSAAEAALIMGVIAWLLYMAFEPQVRKRQPATLVSWSRLLSGRLRDPVVGGDLLVGVALGTAAMCVTGTILNMPFVTGLAPQLMPNTGAFFSLWSQQAVFAVLGGLGYMFLLNLLALMLRREWLAVTAFVLATTMILAPGYGVRSPIAIARLIFLLLLVWYVLTRFGVLTAVAFIYVHNVVSSFPVTINQTAWYAHVTVFAMASVLLVAVYGFHTTLARRPPGVLAVSDTGSH